MQNWEAMQSSASYDQQNSWYNGVYTANIKQEPNINAQMQTPNGGTSQLEQYLKHHQQQQQQLQHQPMDTMALTMTPSPSNNDSSMQHFFDANMQQQFLQQQQYQQQFQQAQQAAAQNHQLTSSQLPLGFNPLTPPGLPNAVLPTPPSHNHFYAGLRPSQQQTPSPLSTTSAMAEHAGKLQAALTPRNTPPMDVTPPKSPKPVKKTRGKSKTKEQDSISNPSEETKNADNETEDDDSLRKPIYNSHGKMKSFKCKNCGLVSITKVAFWEHSRTHMKPEKVLQCNKCPFVTEFKHHLEYHTRKHKNQKPFQCDQCPYTCVNKSMLNSHRKSHSDVYQYSCTDCEYETKYCHSFKLHLRKYDHNPGCLLDEEGNPDPTLVVDVYGTRRGPKNKSAGGATGGNKRSNKKTDPSNSHLSAALHGISMPDQLNQLQLLQQQQQQQEQQLQQQQQQACPTAISPANSNITSNGTEMPNIQLNMAIHQQSLGQQQLLQHQLPQVPNNAAALASILHQNQNMAFLPYWNLNQFQLNLNLQMLAAQQQAVLAQLSPSMREQLQQQQQIKLEQEEGGSIHGVEEDEDEDEEDDDDDDDFEDDSIDSAMDLSQGTPAGVVMNLKVQDSETPLVGSVGASRRKGRMLMLDPEQKSASESPMPSDTPTTASPPVDIATSSTPSSSGNSSNTSQSSNESSSLAGDLFECKFCKVDFKNAVLYTMHMGYHSCDDPFKCNMCGEKCDGVVGFFTHVGRTAHQ